MNIDYPYPPGSRLAAYFRDSGGVSQETSVAQQEAEARRWAAERGYELPEELIFRDIRKSSKNGTVGRKAFLAMTEYFAGGPKTAGLLLWDLTRWGREFKSSLRWFLDIDMRGVKIYTVSEPIPEGPFGIIWVILKLMAAEEENKRKGRDVKRALRQLHQDHNGHLGPIPYGYRAIHEQIGERRDGSPRLVRRLEPDPAEAPIVAEMYRLRAAGYSLAEIRRAVGLSMGMSSYSYILQNPVYVGRWRWGDLESDTLVPALVDADTWTKAVAIHAGHQNEYRRWRDTAYHPRRVHSSYLLSGLLRCGMCGQSMNGKTVNPGTDARPRYYHFYQCSGSFTAQKEPCRPRRNIRAELVEARVMARAREILTTPAILADLHGKLRRRQASAPKVDTDAVEKLARIRKEIANITAMIKAGARSMALAREQEALEDQEADLVARLKKRPTSSRPAVPEELDFEQLAAFGAEAWRAVEASPVREQQLFLRTLLARVTVVQGENKTLSGTIELQDVPGLGDASGLVLPL